MIFSEWRNVVLTKMVKLGFSSSIFYVRNHFDNTLGFRIRTFIIDLFGNINFWTLLPIKNRPNFFQFYTSKNIIISFTPGHF